MTTLDNIRSKVRLVTARPSIDQLTDEQIDTYVNTFYLYDLPESLRLLNLVGNYFFTTNPNIDSYEFDRNEYVSIDPPALANGGSMIYTQDQGQFESMWPKFSSKIQVATGDGTNGPYAFTINSTPFLRSCHTPIGSKGTSINVTVTANISNQLAEIVYDDGVGGFVGATAGNIDYVTGVTNVTFINAIPVGAIIYAHVIPYVASTPTTILFVQDKFILRPVPDGAYVIQLKAYRTPTSLVAGGSSPELSEWWQLLAYGASLKIFTDYGDFDQYQAYRPIYEEQLILMHRRTIKQYANQRAPSMFASASRNGSYSNSWPIY